MRGTVLGALLYFLSVMVTNICQAQSIPNGVEHNPKIFSQIIELSESDFIEIVYDFKQHKNWKYKGNKPAVIEFYTTWCGACKRLEPRLEQLARELSGDVIVYKINSEKSPELSKALDIQAYPTLLFIPTKGIPTLSIGLLSLKQMRAEVEKVRKDRP